MLAMCEFELFEDGDYVCALPFGLAGGTQGVDEKDAVTMAVSWLKEEVEASLMMGNAFPDDLPLGNDARRGGRVLVVAVEAGLNTVDVMTSKEAAEMLGVSQSRVSQMLNKHVLLGFRKGRNAYVSRDSVMARLADRKR